MTSSALAAAPIEDPTVALLLDLYQQYPQAAPVPPVVDVRAFYKYLGMTDTAQDRATFAALIGRSASSVHRLVCAEGTPGRVLMRLIEGVLRMHVPPQEVHLRMSKLAERVAARQGYSDVLDNGWKRNNECEGK